MSNRISMLLFVMVYVMAVVAREERSTPELFLLQSFEAPSLQDLDLIHGVLAMMSPEIRVFQEKEFGFSLKERMPEQGRNLDLAASGKLLAVSTFTDSLAIFKSNGSKFTEVQSFPSVEKFDISEMDSFWPSPVRANSKYMT
jgi:hypothetical protein